MGKLTRIARGAAGVLAVVAYQAGAHHAAATPGAHGFGLALAIVPLLAIALAAALRSAHRAWLLPLWALVCAALWLAREPLARHFEWGLYLEHFSFNLMMAFVFGRTLAAGREPLCTQFAAIVHGTLAPEVARYTRQITVAWTLFFVGMAAVSTLLFATSPIVTWSTFANYLTLPLVGAMFVAESACRRFVLPPAQLPASWNRCGPTGSRCTPGQTRPDESTVRAVRYRRAARPVATVLIHAMPTYPLVFHASPDQTIAWRDGTPVAVRTFLAEVARLAAALPAGGHVFNACTDRYRFTVGLCATLVAGKISLLPASQTPETVRQLAAFAPDVFCLHDAPDCAIELPRFRFPEPLPSAGTDTPVDVPQIDASRVMAYIFTSGSTGTPVPHRKTWGRSSRACARRPRASGCSMRTRARWWARCRRNTCTASSRRCCSHSSAGSPSATGCRSIRPTSARRSKRYPSRACW